MEPTTPKAPARCRHLHTDGRQCGSPAVRHEKLCYQHHAARQRPAHTPTLPDPEDLHAVQRGLAELLRLVARELVEDKQAKRLFLILTAAGTNLARIDRQQARARELDLRQRRLALAETRLAQAPETGHPTTTEPGCPTSYEPGCPTFATALPSLRWASDPHTGPVTEPIDDPLLGPIAPGPEPEPRPVHAAPEPGLSDCHSPRESASVPDTDPAHPAEDPGCPTFGAVSPRLRRASTESQPELPSPARRRELDAEAAEQIEFDRRENAWKEENARIRRENYTIMYNLMVPEAQLKEDLRRAQLQADFHRADLPLGPHPRWGITDQPF